jgi:hypothetical protein
MTRVSVYYAQDCQLCGPAKAAARAVCDRLAVALELVDITGDATLEARYRTEIPVVEIDGRKAFKYYLDEDALEARLRGGR